MFFGIVFLHLNFFVIVAVIVAVTMMTVTMIVFVIVFVIMGFTMAVTDGLAVDVRVTMAMVVVVVAVIVAVVVVVVMVVVMVVVVSGALLTTMHVSTVARMQNLYLNQVKEEGEDGYAEHDPACDFGWLEEAHCGLIDQESRHYPNYKD